MSVSRSFQAVWNKVEKLSQGCLPLSLHLTQAHVHLDLFFREQSLLYVSFYTTEQERTQNLHKKKEAGQACFNPNNEYIFILHILKIKEDENALLPEGLFK